MASMRAAILFGRCSRPPSKQGAPPMKDEATPSAPRVGDIFTVVYPFVREEVSLFGEDGPYESVKWRPGASSENCGPYGDVDIFATGKGQMVLCVQDVPKQIGKTFVRNRVG